MVPGVRMRYAIVVMCVAGCGSSSPKQSMAIGPSGGTVSLTDGTNVVVPQGALTANTTITVEQVGDATPPPGTDPVGHTYKLGPEGQMFAVPVTVTLAVSSEALPPGRTIDEVSIWTAPAGGGAFTQLTTSVGDATHVSAATSHFSLFLPALLKEPSFDLASLMDLSAAIGDGGETDAAASSGDMTNPNADLECAKVPVIGSMSCTLTASCRGHVYELSCSTPDLAGGTCICSTDGTTTNSFQFFGNVCQSIDIFNLDWSSMCGYP
jgi:hypothetical protein